MKVKELISIQNEHSLVESFIMEMANIPTRKTGLDYVVWLGEVGGQHGPRIKVSNIKNRAPKNDAFVVSVDRNPVVLTPRTCKLKQHEIDDIIDWIKLNYDVLMKLYKEYENDVGDPWETQQQLKSI